MAPQPKTELRIRQPVREPEWLRRMREGKHPAKDYTRSAA